MPVGLLVQSVSLVRKMYIAFTYINVIYFFFNLVGVKKMNFRLNEFKACHSV